ncbi:MAG TPA: hypothetical protein VK601_11100 [Kofleriaceae bacterium]|nr:hypothetical protein [Kofleriaceae bacterium]
MTGRAVLAMVGGCAALAVAACEPEGAASDDPETEIGEIAQGLTQVSITTTRGITTTANALADWGGGKQIDPAIVIAGTLTVRYCQEHFPAGSTALANLISALDAYNAVAGVAIHITDIAAAPGTATHPANLATFAAPSNAIYIDYSYAMDPGAFAGTGFDSCDASTPRKCTQAHTYVNGNTVVTDTDVFNSDDAPSVGVFIHELGHVFGMQHINEGNDSVVLANPSNMWFDRTTVHGNKYQRNDHRTAVIQAATHAFLLAYYPAASSGALGTDEIVAHHNMSIADTSTPTATHIEFNPSKSYTAWGTGAALIADKNETKLRWNPLAETGTGVLGAFEPCTGTGTLPRWFARMSETSTSTVNTPFEAVFQVSTTEAATVWTTVAERTFDSYLAGQTEFRQIDWERTFPISAASAGVTGGAGITAITSRQLRFKADSTNVLAERNEQNNDWHVNLCLYPASDTTCQNASVVCAQP